MNVKTILERKGADVATAESDMTLAEAACELAGRGIGALVFVDDSGAPCGIISERDIVRAMAEAGARAAELPVSDFLSSDVCTCALGDTTEGLMEIMTERRIRHLPVVEGGRLCGIVSIGDVVRQRMEEMAFEAEQMKQYIAS